MTECGVDYSKALEILAFALMVVGVAWAVAWDNRG